MRAGLIRGLAMAWRWPGPGPKPCWLPRKTGSPDQRNPLCFSRVLPPHIASDIQLLGLHSRRVDDRPRQSAAASREPGNRGARAAMATRAQSRVTPLEHTIIGGIGGTCEVFVMQPMMAFKNALQEGRPIPTRPRELYRGLLVGRHAADRSLTACCRRRRARPAHGSAPGARRAAAALATPSPSRPAPLPPLQINAGSMMPITATQFGTNRVVEQFLSSRTVDGQLSSLAKFSCAAVAGGVSAFVATPTELIIIQQQKKQTALLAECKSFAATHSPTSLLRGLVGGRGAGGWAGGGGAAVLWRQRRDAGPGPWSGRMGSSCARPHVGMLAQSWWRRERAAWSCLAVAPALRLRRARARAPSSSVTGRLGCCLLQGPCIMRESLYAAGYLGLCPILYDKLKGSESLKVRAREGGGAAQRTAGAGALAAAARAQPSPAAPPSWRPHSHGLVGRHGPPGPAERLVGGWLRSCRSTRLRPCSWRGWRAGCLAHRPPIPSTPSKRACRWVCGAAAVCSRGCCLPACLSACACSCWLAGGCGLWQPAQCPPSRVWGTRRGPKGGRSPAPHTPPPAAGLHVHQARVFDRGNHSSDHLPGRRRAAVLEGAAAAHDSDHRCVAAAARAWGAAGVCPTHWALQQGHSDAQPQPEPPAPG
jgi:hypothetical protein